MPEPDGEPADVRRRAAGWWLAAGTFVIGVFVGGVVVGLAAGGSSDAVSRPAASSPAGPDPGVAAPAATGQVTVNGACLRAINDAQDTYAAIDDLAEAARTVNAARLDEVVRRLQPLQRRLQQDLAACRVTTRLPDGSVSSGPVPTPTPTP